MKTKFFVLATAMLLMASTALAQDNEERRRERQTSVDITEIYQRQATRLVKSLKLKGDTETKFNILYLDWQNARHNAANPRGGDQEGKEQQVDFKNLSDVEATELIQKNFDRQEKQLAVDKEYLPKFLEILTPAQTAQVYLQQGARPGMNQQRQGGQGGRPGGFGGGGGRPGGGFGGPGGGF